MKINIFSENIYADWDLNERKVIQIAKKILKFYLAQPETNRNSCLSNQDFKVISFDFLYCDSIKTHEINREYRQKVIISAG